MKKIYLIIAIIIVIVLAIIIETPSKQTGPIKVGFLGALSGDLASLGDEAKNSTQLAVKEINENGGVDGRKIETVYEDGKCSGIDATSATKKLIEVDKVKIIFGGTCSSETLAAVPITETSKTILFTSWALNPKITLNNNFVFRNAPSDVGGAKAVADLAYRNGVRKISIITENIDYPLGFESIFVEDFKSLGGQVVVKELFNSDNKDLKSVVSKTLAVQSDAILVNAQGSNTGIISKTIKDLGNNKPVYGNVYFADANVLKNYGSYLEGGYTSEPADLDINNDRVTKFLSSYEKDFGSKPQYLFWAAASYDAVNIYAEAVRKVGYDSVKIKDYLHKIENYDGVLGKYAFDKNGDVVGIKFADKQVVNNHVQLIK